MTPTEKIEEMVRDFCSVTPNIKSEVRRRIYEALAEEKARVADKILDIIQNIDWIEEPRSALGSLNDILSYLKPLTGKDK